MKIRILAIISVLSIVILSACGQNEIKDALNYQVEDFKFVDQNNESFGLKNLEGKVWVADFIYTNCPDVCMPMTFNMQKLQTMAAEEGIENLEFVSFSVDPTVDTPEVLTAYGEQYQANFNNWHFLTGYEQAEIEQIALDQFKTLVKKPEAGDQVMHGISFYLIDQEGKVMKDYDGVYETPFEEILQDIKTLQ